MISTVCMDWGDIYKKVGVILLIGCFLLICGCVEVTPPSRPSKNSSVYGPVGSNGEWKFQEMLHQILLFIKGSNSTGNVSTGSSTTGNKSFPDGKFPEHPSVAVVQVTPRSLEGLPVATETQSYSAKDNRSAIGPDQEFVPIYQINHTFLNDAIAYAYTIDNPPLYIDLQFSPVNENHVISYEKRTGDKEGLINVTVNRPLKDAWFEMRVYNQNDGSEVLREGYGKTYSQSNKTVILRTSGAYQFDFLGNFINATVILKVPVSQDALIQYQNVTGLIDTKKQVDGLIPNVYLDLSDLPTDWKVAGDITHTPTEYQSIFFHPASGYKLQQDIKKFDSTDKAITALAALKTQVSSENPSGALIGQGGFQFESVRKTEIAFVQGLYLIELESYSVPAVTLNDLQRYGKIIISRINSSS